jgi:diamine N-acetyltransferase
MPFAIYQDETVVGFVLIAYGITSYELPKIAEGNYTIIRFMIDMEQEIYMYVMNG